MSKKRHWTPPWKRDQSPRTPPPPFDVMRLARRSGLWLLAEGVGDSITWIVYSTTTGQLAFSYTPKSGNWWTAGRRLNGREPTFSRALRAWAAAGRPIPNQED